MVSDRTEEFWVAPDPAAIRDLRHAVRRVCSDTDPPADACETVVLLTSETVTNAIVHGGPPVHLTIRVSAAGIRVDVTDSTTAPPVIVPAQPDATGGRGIQLIDALATRWGVERRTGGKTVWFEITPAPTTAEPRLS
jgi:anti-sigma regulatory factor (Ser/Thr protein kinase)